MFKSGSRKYWIIQFLGWGAVALYWSYYQISFDDPSLLQVSSVIFPFLLAIGYTHLYRNMAHKYGWVNLPLSKLIFVLIMAWACLTAAYMFVSFINAMILFGYMNSGMWMGVITGGARYSAIWLLAFHLYHLSKINSAIPSNIANKGANSIQGSKMNHDALPDQIFVKDGDGYFHFKTEEIIFFESVGNYVKIHSKDDYAMTKKSLSAIEKRTDSKKFFRANRQIIFNTNKIVEVRNIHKGKVEVLLQNNRRVQLSERKSVLFKEMLKL